MWRRAQNVLIALVLSLFVTSTSVAQSGDAARGDLLVLDTDRLFSETIFGQNIVAKFQAARERLSSQNRQIEAELEAEEKLLTELRAEISPREFKGMADAFDAKVQELRRTSDTQVRELERSRELAPITFMRAVEPILVELMVETGGTVVLDKRSVLLRRDVVDITDLAIARIDLAVGEGKLSGAQKTDQTSGNTETQE